MSKEIWKYPLMGHRQDIEMPIGAQPLCVQMQEGVPTLWALVDPWKRHVRRKINIYGTGHKMPDDAPGLYIGTFQQDSNIGRLVWHAFDGGEREEIQ